MIFGNKFLNESTEIDIQNVINEIWELIEDIIPDGFNKICFYVVYSVNSFEMNFYVNINGQYLDAFHLGVSKSKILSIFIKIDKMIKKVKFYSNKPTAITLMIDNNGMVKTDMDYNDHSEDSIEYIRNWKKKYLN